MTSQCSSALLEAALQGSLPADDEAALTRHLEECEACGAALEQMAGGATWRQEAAALLAGDELDDAVPVHGDWSEVDFTVDHLEPSDEPNVLGRLGGYDVLEILGRGGMGVVLKAFDRELKRCVAIKVLAPHLAHSSLAKKRFAREAQAAAAVVHPHVLAIHHVQAGGRLPFLVMPLVAGESLAERLAKQGTLELKEILRIGMQAAAGLAAAHGQGLVHRDVKPANILLEIGVERAVLTDFGLARAADDVALTRWGIIAGTPQYMSPEQAKGEPLDGRSDLFSLGCVLYEMATGVSPFRTDSVMATMRRLVDDSPQAMGSLNPELPPWFIAIVDRLLEKDPTRRFGSAKEVSELLEGCLAHVQQLAAVPLPASLETHATRGRWIFNSHRKGVIAMLGAIGFTLLGIVLWQASQAPDNSLPGSKSDSTPAKQLDESQSKTATAIPQRVHHFSAGATVRTIACSADGKLIAIANGNPTLIMQTTGRSRVKDNWKPSAEILHAGTGKTVVSLKLTTNDEDTVLAATERVPDFEVTALAFSPDGNAVAVGTTVGQVKLFNTRTGEFVRSLDDKQAKLADKKTPEKLKSLTRALGSVASLAFSPDGSLLAMCGGSFDDSPLVWEGVGRLTRKVTGPGRLKVWDVKTGTLKQDLVGHSHANTVSFSPDGNLLASAGRWEHAHEWGTGVIIWNPHTGKKLRTFEKLANGGTHAVAFSPNSKLVVIGSRTFDKDTDGSTTTVSLTYALSGIMEWQQTIPGWANPKAFSPDGKSVAVLCGGQSIRFFDTETGGVKHEIRSADSPQGGRWNDFAITPQGPTLVIGGTDAGKRGFVAVWDLDGAPVEGKKTSEVPRQMFRLPTKNRVSALAYSPDGNTLAIGGDPETVGLFEAKTGRRLTSLKLFSKEEKAILAAANRAVGNVEVRALAFSQDSTELAVGTSIGQVKLFDARTGAFLLSLDGVVRKAANQKPLHKFLELRLAQGNVWAVAFSPDGKLLATCGDAIDYNQDGVSRLGLGPFAGLLKLWDAKTGELKQDLQGEHAGQVLDVAFSPDGKFLASAGHWPLGTGVKLWDPQTGKVTKVLAIPNGHLGGGSPNCFSFSPDGKRLAMSIMKYDKSTDVTSGSINVVYPASGILDLSWLVPRSMRPVAFSPDGKTIAALSAKSTLTFWDAATGLPQREIRPTGQPDSQRWECFAFAPKANVLAIGGIDVKTAGFVEVWNLDSASAEGK